MQVVFGLFIVLAGLGMAGQAWYAHVAVVAFGILVICIPGEDKKPS